MRQSADGPTDDRTAPAISHSIRMAYQPGGGGAKLQAGKSSEQQCGR